MDNLLDGVAGPLPQKPLHYLARIRDNADRLSRMVSDLLDLTRIEAGKVELCPEALAVGDVVGDAAESLRQVARTRGLVLALDLAPCPSAWGDLVLSSAQAARGLPVVGQARSRVHKLRPSRMVSCRGIRETS